MTHLSYSPKDFCFKGRQFARRTIALVTLTLLFVCSFDLSPVESQRACEDISYPVTKMGIRKSVNSSDGSFPPGTDIRAVPNDRVAGNENPRYVRVQIEAINIGNCSWYVTVRDEHHHVVQTLVPADFATSNLIWTQRIPGRKAIVDFQRCQRTPSPQIQVREIILMPEQATNTYYSSKIPSRPDWSGLYENLENAANKPHGNYHSLGDYVGLVMSSAGNQSWVCSGVMVSKDILLTNWHCGGPSSATLAETEFWNDRIVKDTIIDLSFDDDLLSREYMGVECLIKDIEHDFALLRIAPINVRDTPRPAPISLGRLDAATLQIVHHPSGQPKRISYYGCTVVDSQYPGWRNSNVNSEFTHQCDTERGSSGAAVFNLKGELVGLHHLGYATKGGICDHKNKAVSLKSIVDFISIKRPDLLNELQLIR